MSSYDGNVVQSSVFTPGEVAVESVSANRDHDILVQRRYSGGRVASAPNIEPLLAAPPGPQGTR